MDLIEVDPELFVKCRLCLLETGMYQIVPIVQQQIKFCFDIEVNLFDGLPQLICKKCKYILSDYFTTKTTFIEKQNTLKTKFEAKNEIAIESCHPPQLGTISSSQEEIDERKEFSYAKKRRTYLVSSSATSDDVGYKRSASPIGGKKKYNTSCTKSSPLAWEAHYRKKIVCVMCQKRFRKKSSLTRHFEKHGNMISRYHNVLKTYCTVNLNKTDSQPNMTGVLSTVVYSQDKIISNEGKMNYYVLYTPKKRTNSEKNTSDGCENTQNAVDQSAYSVSSDDGMFVKRRQKKPRLLSRSSNETVVLEGEKNGCPISSDDERGAEEAGSNVTECINIDDSSDTASYKSTKDLSRADKSFKAKINELKQIQNINSVCHSKYLKRKESENCVPIKYSGSTESQLKHKILNMGRKVITKQGFNCTGLLRFVENKILEIIWMPTKSTTSVNANKETNYVRIMPKLRGKQQYHSDNLGWKFITETHEDYSEQANSETPDDNISVDQTNPIKDTVSISPVVSSSGSLNGHLKENKSLVVGHMNENQTHVVKAVDQAVLYTMNADIDTSLKSKLLNASPVANPKQLPKKSTDSKSIIKSDGNVLQTSKQSDAQNNEFRIYLEEEDNSDRNVCMPIIMSTTSLASCSSKGKEDNVNNNKDETSNSNVTTDSDTCTPRIKVKPVSELMSERVLKNLSQQQATAPSNIWGLNQNVNVTLPYQNTVNHVHAPNMALQSQGNGVPAKTLDIFPVSGSTVVPTAPLGAAPLTVDREYITLDTVELPNMRTDSPFNYFKKLLKCHNIILLDTHENVSQDFVCLVKCTLQYRQETVDQPVILHLSFLCAANKYYLGVKYGGQENNIDMNMLPVNWQWEILNKIYQDEIVNKLLKNAQNINQTVYENTNNFLCLLKSIQFKRHD